MKASKKFASSLIGLGLTCLTMSGQEKQSHLEYKIPSDAIKSELLSHRGSDKNFYRTYAVKADNKLGKEVIAWEYFTNEKRTQLKLYKNGTPHGIWKTWHSNGVLESESPYNMGKSDGGFKLWDQGGNLISQYTLVKGTGVIRKHYANGQLKVYKELTNDSANGFLYSFHENGKMWGMRLMDKKSNIGVNLGFRKEGLLSHIYNYEVR